MRFRPSRPGVEYLSLVEYLARVAKYTPFPYAVAEKDKYFYEVVTVRLSGTTLTKKSQWYFTDYHSIPFSISDISAGLSGTLNGNLKYHSILLNGTKNPKYH